MATELDMSQYLELFLQEAEEQLDILERELLLLEQEPSDERLQVVFRSAHTLKGSGRAMGFENFAVLTHSMEDVLDQLRNGQLEVGTELANALLEGLDNLRKMSEGISAGQGDGIDCTALVQRLESFVRGEVASGPTTKPVKSELPEEEIDALRIASKDSPIWHASFTLQPDCVMKFARAFMAISAIQEDGELLHTVPAREKLEEEKFEQHFELYFHSKSPEESLKASFREISEVANFTLQVWKPPARQEQTDTVRNNLPQAPAPQAATASRKTETGQTVRVDVSRLDNLMNLVGELVIDRTRLASLASELATRHNDRSVDHLSEAVSHIARITSDLQDQIMKARMMPIETVFSRFPRVVRDLAQKLGKDVRMEVSGGETELDRSVIEVIGDPLLHMLRNCVDHAIETPDERRAVGKPTQGVVKLSALHLENHIVIEIVDDGRGIDCERLKAKAISQGLITTEQANRMSEKEALQLIFSSGVSTAKAVTEVSGRGVGMDIVRSNLQKLGGIIDLETKIGEGTKFSLRLPLTLAIIRGLLVSLGKHVYVLPLDTVIETLLIERREIQTVNQHEVIVIRGMTTPLMRLGATLGISSETGSPEDEPIFVVIVGLAEKRLGLVVDRLIGEQEVVIKSLSRFCGDITGVSGATILGDGNVALIVDVNSLVNTD
ncbi:MAG: chemotaxis protein CheA [Fimbriimonadaceae bacterium]|nr:chemotaxis protein CheA [Fimbriimonadaceae bacterium]QYK55613.1 MAG: chemotaxis protein CheA [Fimbriimonadaceae bacterium]